MKFKKILPIIGLSSMVGIPMATTSFTSCSTLHIHTFTSDYECDETHHWKTCKICHERFDYGEHTFNDLNDKCLICGYQDPLVRIDPQTSEMYTLTSHGMNKYTFNCPSTVACIGHHAFKGSKAKLVVINKECDWYWEDAFAESNVAKVSYEEGMVGTHTEIDKKTGNVKVVIDHVLKDKVAKIGNNYYKTLKEAVESTTIGDTTITLLQEQIKETDPIKVTHSITLVPYHSAALLQCNFNIGGAGIVYIPDSIRYEGKAKLLLCDYKEIHSKGDTGEDGNEYKDVYSTGSIVFTNTSTAPNNVKVSYVHSFESSQEYEAVGSQQVVNTLLVLPTDNYAWGTFRFSKDFKEIWGLTEYGQTINHLYMTNVVKETTASVGDRAFSIGWEIKVKIPLESDFVIKLFIPKGWFFHLTIGNGITSIGTASFNAHVAGNLDGQAVDWLYPVFSHLFTLDLGPDLQTVGKHAFWGSVGLESVTSGENLQSLGEAAFEESYNLVSADFSKSPKFNKIEKNTFKKCNSLLQTILPPGMWSMESNTYFPYNLQPERMAYTLVQSCDKSYTKKTYESAPYWYTKSASIDAETGWFNDVTSTDKLDTALSSCADGGEVYLSPEASTKVITNTYNKTGITLTAAPELGAQYVPIGSVNIKPNGHLILSNVEPIGEKIIIRSEKTDDLQFSQSGGFAIDGLTPEKRSEIAEKVYIANGSGTEAIQKKAGANKANIRGTEYDAFGLYDFNVTESQDVNTATIRHLSSFGRLASNITFGSPIAKDSSKTTNVILDKNNEGFPTNNMLVNVNIDDTVTEIGEGFFDTSFKKLQNVTIGENVGSLGKFAFGTLPQLKSVDMQNPDLKLSQGDFKNCYELKTINLPANLKEIPATCFSGCRALTYIDIPATVEKIVSNAFLNCSALVSVSLPTINSLSEIQANAFQGCTSLYSFDFGQNINSWYVGDFTEPLPYDELSDPTLAALLIQEYVDKNWTTTPPSQW